MAWNQFWHGFTQHDICDRFVAVVHLISSSISFWCFVLKRCHILLPVSPSAAACRCLCHCRRKFHMLSGGSVGRALCTERHVLIWGLWLYHATCLLFVSKYYEPPGQSLSDFTSGLLILNFWKELLPRKLGGSGCNASILSTYTWSFVKKSPAHRSLWLAFL